MNSIIEAQQQFTECFGELCLSDLCSNELLLPHFSNELVKLDEFIEAHSKVKSSATIKIEFSKTSYLNCTQYNFYHE